VRRGAQSPGIPQGGSRGEPPWSSPASIPSRAHATRIAFSQLSNEQTSKVNRPVLCARLEPDRISNECFPDKPLSASPLYLPVAPDPSNHPLLGILDEGRPSLADSRPINLGRWSLPQRFVWANVVVDLHPPIGSALLRPPVARRRPSCFRLHDSMHLFVGPVLFRMAWSDELHRDSHHGPPSAQTRKSRWAGRSKRPPVVHSDDPWIAVASKEPQEDSPHRLPPLIGQQPDAQQIAAVQIPYRQRFHPLAILRPEPAFEVHRPYLVAALGYCQVPTPEVRPTPSTPTNTTTELQLLEPPSNRPGRRNTRPFVLPGQSSPQFATSPAPMSSPQLLKTFQPLRACLPGRAMGTASSIQESPLPVLLEALSPFVATLAADSKRPTQPRHALLGLQSQLHEPHPSRHLSKDIPCHEPRKGGK
jgi:hypothetical protein